MARILLACSLNADRVFELDDALRAGGRVDARGLGLRFGGAGANIGSALAAAGHRVDVACALGDDETGDWLRARAVEFGIGLGALARYSGKTPEVLLLRQPDGERTIVFLDRREPYAPPPRLAERDDDLLFVNSASAAAAELMKRCLHDRWVVAQLPQRPLPDWPAHLLIGSADDLTPALLAEPFAAGREMAGAALRYVVITYGARGARLYDAGGGRVDVPAHRAERVVDTTGAGDVFAAGLIDALARGDPPHGGDADIDAALAQAARWAAFAVAEAVSVAPVGLRDHLAARRR